MPDELDPYAFDAPQWADLSKEVKVSAMSAETQAWFGALSPHAPTPPRALRQTPPLLSARRRQVAHQRRWQAIGI